VSRSTSAMSSQCLSSRPVFSRLKMSKTRSMSCSSSRKNPLSFSLCTTSYSLPRRSAAPGLPNTEARLEEELVSPR
jgi:hypothetical protein